MMEDIIVPEKRELQTQAEIINQMGIFLSKLTGLVTTLQHRVDELEAREYKVTLTHNDVKTINAMIRRKADSFCEKNRITDAGSLRAVRAAIKKDILQRYSVKDLHDIPAFALPNIEKQIETYANIRLVMKRREALAVGCP